MATVCFECHAVGPDQPSSNRFARCETCGHGIPTGRQPLFVVTGADASGKSAVVPRIAATHERFVVLDKDLLFGPWSDDQEYSRFLRIAFGVAAGQRALVLVGCVQPEDIERSPWRVLVEQVHWALLDCENDTRVHRLGSRPKSASLENGKIAAIFDTAARLRESLPSGSLVLSTDHLDEGGVAHQRGRPEAWCK